MKAKKMPIVKKIPGLASRRREEPSPADPDNSAYFCGSAQQQTRDMYSAFRRSNKRQIKSGLLKIIPNK